MIKTTEKTLSLKEIVLGYKDLMNIEKMFRDLKDFIEVAPVYHRLNRRVRAHIFVCVLALLVQKYMHSGILKQWKEKIYVWAKKRWQPVMLMDPVCHGN